ncbi:MAG TPA: winged helix DNA-binding protein [Nitrosopumilaceae archaeon]|nr:winged helix DNA-binding protein [Nitrosopumilaceae archaeon]
MLVEIPDVDVMVGVALAFVAGLFAIIIYNKVKPLMRKESEQVKSYIDRLQYYENQLIDMRIRMDSLELDENVSIPEAPIKAEKKHIKTGHEEVEADEEPQKERMRNMNFGSATDYVLKLITEKPMTSRDIQITIGRTREHTSRMMKKLFEEGYVERNMKTKPFTYYITDKGKSKLGLLKITS